MLCQHGRGKVRTGGQRFADGGFFLPGVEESSTAFAGRFRLLVGLGHMETRSARDSLRISPATIKGTSLPLRRRRATNGESAEAVTKGLVQERK